MIVHEDVFDGRKEFIRGIWKRILMNFRSIYCLFTKQVAVFEHGCTNRCHKTHDAWYLGLIMQVSFIVG